jgi:hypothetical protein
MDKQTRTRVIEILETDVDFYVPVKRLWRILQGEGLIEGSSLEEFHRILTDDESFEFAPELERFEDDPEMEALGLYSGPRVKLASREMTAEDVFAAMARSLARMNDALQGAWETRPENDLLLENQLLDILAAGQKLEREIHELIDQ